MFYIVNTRTIVSKYFTDYPYWVRKNVIPKNVNNTIIQWFGQ